MRIKFVKAWDDGGRVNCAPGDILGPEDLGGIERIEWLVANGYAEAAPAPKASAPKKRKKAKQWQD